MLTASELTGLDSVAVGDILEQPAVNKAPDANKARKLLFEPVSQARSLRIISVPSER